MLDIIIYGGYVVTMEGPGTGLINNGAVGIKGNKIEVVGSTDEVMRQYKAHRYIEAIGKAILPGFVDVHMHTSNAIVRGVSQDLPASEWMFRGILPMLSVAQPDDLAKGSMLNILEALKSGTTTFCDFDVPMLAIAPNYEKAKVRAVLSNMINELPVDVSVIEHGIEYPLNSAIGQQKLADNTALIEHYHQSNGGRITCRYGPQAVDMCSVELLREIKNLADQKNVLINMHVTQSKEEIVQCKLRTGKRPVALLEELGYLNSHLLAAHMTNAELWEVEQVARSGAALCLCSNSIDIISGELPPAQEFLSFGGKVGLGTDQAPGNNCNMMFNEMKITALLHKYKNADATVFPAWKVLRMETIEAAQALGMEKSIGSLRAGKLADIIIVNLQVPHLTPILEVPVRNIVPNLVYAARGGEVETVLVDGQFVVENHKVLTVNECEAVTEANAAARSMELRLQKEAWTKTLPLARWTQEEYY